MKEGTGKGIDFHWIKNFKISASKFLPSIIVLLTSDETFCKILISSNLKGMEVVYVLCSPALHACTT